VSGPATLRRGTRYRVVEPVYDPELRTLENDIQVDILWFGSPGEATLYALADGTQLTVEAGDDADAPPFLPARDVPGNRLPDVVELGPLRLLRDLPRTRAAFQALPGSGYAGPDCGPCAPCRNFALARTISYPPEVVRFLEALGVDPTSESEIAGSRNVDGWDYVTWFDAAAVGILERPHHFEVLIEGVRIGSTEVAVVPGCGPKPWDEPSRKAPAFGPGPMVAIQIRLRGVPWLLDEAEPLAASRTR
jgi:hypothetical protein